MSLFDRAAITAQAEIGNLHGQRAGLLGQVDGARVSMPVVHRLPDTWTAVHVLDRLEEAFVVLARLPVATRPRAFGNAMPAYVYDRYDLNAQMEGGELNRLLRQKNRVVIPPTPAEIARMEQAFHWPLKYLDRYPLVAQAVCFGAMWAVQRADIVKRCAGIGIPEHRVRWFLRRKMHGLNIIAVALIRGRVPVT